MSMIANALTALARATCSRRDVLKGAGALIIGVSAVHVTAPLGVAQGPFDTRASHVDPQQLDAEELSVPVARVRLIACDTAVCPDQGTTSGSQSTPTNFNVRNLAQAAATAREALLRLAVARLAVPVEQLTVTDGVISAQADRTKSVSYGELVAGLQFNMPLSATA